MSFPGFGSAENIVLIFSEHHNWLQKLLRRRPRECQRRRRSGAGRLSVVNDRPHSAAALFAQKETGIGRRLARYHRPAPAVSDKIIVMKERHITQQGAQQALIAR